MTSLVDTLDSKRKVSTANADTSSAVMKSSCAKPGGFEDRTRDISSCARTVCPFFFRSVLSHAAPFFFDVAGRFCTVHCQTISHQKKHDASRAQLMSLTTCASGNTVKTQTQVQLGELSETRVKSLERHGHEMRQRPNRTQVRDGTHQTKRQGHQKTARESQARRFEQRNVTQTALAHNTCDQHCRKNNKMIETHRTKNKNQRTRKPTDTQTRRTTAPWHRERTAAQLRRSLQRKRPKKGLGMPSPQP